MPDLLARFSAFWCFGARRTTIFRRSITVSEQLNCHVLGPTVSILSTTCLPYHVSVIMVISVDSNNELYVLEYERHRSIPTIGSKAPDNGEIIGKKGVVDYILELHEKYHCTSSTVEDVAMNRSIFQALNDERRRINRFDIAVIPEKPGGTNKRNRIYSGLSARFSTGTVHLRKNMFDLINEIVTFGPKMSHDDTIESLYYAQVHSFPPNMKRDKEKKRWFKPKRKAKSWIVA